MFKFKLVFRRGYFQRNYIGFMHIRYYPMELKYRCLSIYTYFHKNLLKYSGDI